MVDERKRRLVLALGVSRFLISSSSSEDENAANSALESTWTVAAFWRRQWTLGTLGRLVSVKRLDHHLRRLALGLSGSSPVEWLQVVHGILARVFEALPRT